MARFAIILNAGPPAVGPSVNALTYAIQLNDADHEVAVFLDGPATKWPSRLRSLADHPLRDRYATAAERSLIRGACGSCAASYGTAEACRQAGLELYGSTDEHGPDVGQLVADGYRLVTVG